MLKISLIALSAVVSIAASTAALAGDPENQIADRYPFLEQNAANLNAKALNYRMSVAPTAQAGGWNTVVPERHVSGAQPNTFAGAVREPAGARVTVADPENRIADRYPQLEPATRQQAARPGYLTAGRFANRGNI